VGLSAALRSFIGGAGPTAAFRAFITAVSAAGVVLVGAVLTGAVAAPPDRLEAVVVLFAIAILVAELFPLDIPGHEGQATFSTTFAFALLLAAGTGAVIVIHVACVVVADLIRRRTAEKLVFNAAQYALSWGAAGGVLALASAGLPDRGGLEYLALAQAPAVVAAAGTFLVVNVVLASTAPALADRTSPLAYMRADLGFQLASTVVLIALVPVVLVVAAYDAALIPLLWIPLIAIERGGREAVINQYQAMHDTLTGLPNRAHLHARLDAALQDARDAGAPVAMLLMDLDGFKEINDTLGHHHGDLLLREVAGRLRGRTRASELVARLGGDEFALLIPAPRGVDECVTVAERLLQGLEAPIEIEGIDLDVRASVGIALTAAGDDEVDALLSRADVAMYHAKETGKGWALYDDELNVHTPERLALVADLRRGIERDELILHYQPKVDLASGRLEGVEALVRWCHPERGVLPPGDFVGLAEHTGLVRPLTRWVVREALAQARRWREQGLEATVAVNLSVRALTRELPRDVAALLAEGGTPGEWLELEITETMVMHNPDEALEILQALADLGISLAVDDFGTGYSSLGYLKRLPVREIKIDRSFVTNMDRDDSDRAIVRSTIDLARHLGLRVVAEGVETAEVLRELRELGCASAQGFYFSRPVAADAMLAWAGARRRTASGLAVVA
jgi:diguanylate cyclase (GGDEF)-like protein